MNNSLEIIKNLNDIIISKGETLFGVKKTVDNDIWFNTNKENIKLSVSKYAQNQDERNCYIIFENLIKSIISRYILNDYKDKFNTLPKDFIDLENKTITWHSDDSIGDVLQLQYTNTLSKNEIVISISKDINTINNYKHPIKVRIRTSGSEYGNYYQEFEKFYSELYKYSNPVEVKNTTSSEESKPIFKKLFLPNRFKK